MRHGLPKRWRAKYPSLHIDGKQATVDATVGIGFCPDHGEDIAQLIKYADEATYRVKNNSKHGFGFAVLQ